MAMKRFFLVMGKMRHIKLVTQAVFLGFLPTLLCLGFEDIENQVI